MLQPSRKPAQRQHRVPLVRRPRALASGAACALHLEGVDHDQIAPPDPAVGGAAQLDVHFMNASSYDRLAICAKFVEAAESARAPESRASRRRL